MSSIKPKKFDPIAPSSKIGICGIPTRVDAYSICSYGCIYCESNNRAIMAHSDELKIGDIKALERRLHRVIDEGKVNPNDIVDHLIAEGHDWHFGGLADPWQPYEAVFHIAAQIIALSVRYHIPVVISTKGADEYGADIRPDLHAIQLSITNANDGRDIEPNVPSIQQRLEFFYRLKKNGFRVAIRIQPFIPGVSGLDIVQMFDGADHYIIEGLKLPMQKAACGREIAEKLGLNYDSDFVAKGMKMLAPELRLALYAPLIKYFEEHGLSYSISDNDLRYIGNNNCCCGDVIVRKPVEFNTTYFVKKYGVDFSREQFNSELCKLPCTQCTCSKIRASNRTKKGETFEQLANRVFDSPMSPMSPKFQYRGPSSR